jgi:predicted ATPase
MGRINNPEAHPFCLPFLQNDFELSFDRSITIIVGENGAGESTLLEEIAAVAGYDEAGAAKGIVRSIIRWRSRRWAESLQPRRARAGCRKLAARYLDQALLHSRLGFLRFFEERCQRQGIFIFDEPESALSPSRQIEFLKLMHRMDHSQNGQIIMATHSPMLMVYPGARLLVYQSTGWSS